MALIKTFSETFAAEDKDIHIDIITDDIVEQWQIFIRKGTSVQDFLRYLDKLEVPDKLLLMVTAIDACERAHGMHAREFDKTVRQFAIYTDLFSSIIDIIYDDILPQINNDLGVYTFKKYKRPYADKALMRAIIDEIMTLLKEHFRGDRPDRGELKKKLLLFYRSVYGLKELSEAMLSFMLKFKLPKFEAKFRSISLTMIDDYPFYGENLLFGRYATNIRSRHFHEEFESALKNHKTAISGVLCRMNHNSKLLNGTAEKYFKKTYKTPITDIFATIILWCIEAVHISESMANTLKALGDPQALQDIPDDPPKDRGYAAAEGLGGTVLCEATFKADKLTGIRYYNGHVQNLKQLQKMTKQFLDANKTSTELQKNLKLLLTCLMPRAYIDIVQKDKPQKPKEEPSKEPGDTAKPQQDETKTQSEQ